MPKIFCRTYSALERPARSAHFCSFWLSFSVMRRVCFTVFLSIVLSPFCGVFKGYAPSASTPGSGVDGDCAVAIRCSLSLWTSFYALMKSLLPYKFLFLLSKKKYLLTYHQTRTLQNVPEFRKDFQKFLQKRKSPLEHCCSKGP